MSGVTLLPKVLILGGAGFIGSRIARAFSESDWEVTILDGLLEGTGGRQENLPEVRFIHSRVEDYPEWPELISSHTLIVDALAWTAHLLAIRAPLRDLDLNVGSHLFWLSQLPVGWLGKVIFLGSRGQYGNPEGREITESTPQTPEDIQGIHKVAAELHFRFYSRLRNVPVISLRFPAVVGPHQPTQGEDIGLFGGFIRDLINGKTVEVYGEGRCRAVVHVDDIAEIVFQLAGRPWEKFQAFNISGHHVALVDVLKYLVAIIGRGQYAVRPIPGEIKTIDLGALPVSEARLTALLGGVPRRDLSETLSSAVEYFRNTLP